MLTQEPWASLLSSRPLTSLNTCCSGFSCPHAHHSESLFPGPAEAPVLIAPPCPSLLIISPGYTVAGQIKPCKAGWSLDVPFG